MVGGDSKAAHTDKELNKEEVTKADRCRDREIHTEIIQHKED